MTSPSPSNPELLPCPFCGGTDIGLADNTGPKLCTAPHAYAWCRNAKCFASGNESDTVAEAITAWNQRSNLPSDGAVGELVDELERLHNNARGCEFDLVPADGPIARLALFMHEHGCTLVAALTRLAAGQSADAKRIEALEGARSIEWNDEVAFILGRPCFMFIQEARLFRSLGYDIPTQAENEQAFFLHRWLNFYLEHGEAWRDVATADMREHIARQALSPTPGKDG